MLTRLRSNRLPAALLAAALLAVTVAACGGGEESSGGEEPAFNGTDVSFSAQMIPHHEHGVEMAELAVEKSDNPEIRDLAQRIAATQQQEITELQGFLDTFGAEPATPPAAVMERNASIAAELEGASGEEFDLMFLERMSAHHNGAVQMSSMEVEGGEFQDTVQLAEEIRATQLEEIAEMQVLMGTAQALG